MPGFPTSTRAGNEARRAERTTGQSGSGPGSSKTPSVWKMLPDVWALIKPRRAILAGGFALMAINRVSGLVLPASSKYLLAATVVQGLTSYSLTQLLSKSSQRMITELRVKVQAHIGRLPVSYYDANKTGALDRKSVV